MTDFQGDWRVERRIVHGGGDEARFSGTASLVPDGQGLSYSERGALSVPGRPAMTAERRYLWRPGGAGSIEVFFDDGRAFHRFDPTEGAPTARHVCTPDIYEVTYDLRHWPDWSCLWRVRGPRKAYEMVSNYRR